MDNCRTLPPEINGKIRSVLNFSIVEVRINNNTLALPNSCDVVVQVQWWGEILPVNIRPRELYLTKNRVTSFLKSQSCSAKYEIKTKLALFTLYLQTCEILELVVVEETSNTIIGSAFLKDLIRLINKSSEIITLPIINFLGEAIGDVTVHTNFLELNEHNCDTSECLTTSLNKHIDTKNKFTQMKRNSRNYILHNRDNQPDLQSAIQNDREKSYKPKCSTKYCDFPVKYNKTTQISKSNLHTKDEAVGSSRYKPDMFSLPQKDKTNESLQFKSIVQNDDYFTRRNTIDHYFENQIDPIQLNVNTPGFRQSDSTNSPNMVSDETPTYLPKVNNLEDLSEVYYTDLPKSQHKKEHKIKIPPCVNDCDKNDFKIEKKTKTNMQPLNITFLNNRRNSPDLKRHFKITKKISSNTPRKFKVSTDPKIRKSRPLKPSGLQFQNFSRRGRSPNNLVVNTHYSSGDRDLNLQEIRENQLVTQKVLDYLLGTKMSAEDEEIALNELKKLSPSQNFVNSFNQLCSVSDKNCYPQLENYKTENSDSGSENLRDKKKKLSFDLNNAIERNYYEKFFARSKSHNALDIAEFLNRPENSSALRKLKTHDKVVRFAGPNVSPASSNRSSLSSQYSKSSPILKKTRSSSSSITDSTVLEHMKNSIRRYPHKSMDKYYTKLRELDTVMKSLKSFEQKMFQHEEKLLLGLDEQSKLHGSDGY